MKKYSTESIKAAIKEYFSDELQNDESPSGAKRRWEIQEQLANWAKGTHMVRSLMNGATVEEPIDLPYTCSVASETYWSQ